MRAGSRELAGQAVVSEPPAICPAGGFGGGLGLGLGIRVFPGNEGYLIQDRTRCGICVASAGAGDGAGDRTGFNKKAEVHREPKFTRIRAWKSERGPKRIMYQKFFGLRESPFNVNPDPRYLFLTKQIQEALAGLTYGIQNRKGFILLTGEVGTGKTTLLNRLLDWLHGQRVKTAFRLQLAGQRKPAVRLHDGRFRNSSRIAAQEPSAAEVESLAAGDDIAPGRRRS